ncbi:hypothetical protein [Bacillus marasmi]|uniref:hypothetical protein n=1 Tax=Bacillus marasmi TaxID=1926279 RepID=UPI0011CCAD48|nr:hypothetical protein [Bacillus marasmi]
MEAPKLEVVKEAIEEKPAQAGIFIKFIVLVLVPTLYGIGLVMLLLHFAGVNIQTQVKTVGNVAQPLIALFDAPKSTAPPTEKEETDTESTTETKTSNEEVPYSNKNDTESSSGNNDNNPTSSQIEDNNQDSNIASSVEIYANLKPEQIAIIFKGIEDREEVLRQFRKLDPKTASKVIVLLNPDIAGWIITQMD